jgi:hypothetical protein
MTLGGWITLSLSVGFVVGLLSWCIWKLCRGHPVTPAPDDKNAPNNG